LILLLDNFDSFTHLLADYLHQLNEDCDIRRNDCDISELTNKKYEGIILSPGPGVPDKAGNLPEVIEYFHKKIPVLGICLGHQAIGTFFGAQLIKGKRPMHGKISSINCADDELFSGLPKKLEVVRYHSLVLSNLPDEIISIARSDDGEIMAIKHKKYPVYGMQFHPEAILTDHGLKMLKNWLILNKIRS
jgi:anthranilate synthase/aminodeoxychorismate synthase-like glutamine amidotransferase